MADWQRALDESRDRNLMDLAELVRIPSVSAEPEHAADVQRAAEWVAARLTRAGLENARVWPTAGHPIVCADWLHAPGRPTYLIYGHFDVQPAKLEDGWDHPPFEPLFRDGRLYARGASDNKGNMLVPILAVEALLRAEGRLPVNVRFFLEGQEEIGSPQAAEFVREHAELLACDAVISSDTGQDSEDAGSLLVSLRGLCGLQVDVTGPNSDLHSGLYGGAVQNPIHALAAMLASLRDADGRITVPGFYDEVRELSAAERAAIADVPWDEAAFMARLGVEHLWGEAGYTPRERIWVRPTLELNGIWGGFQGEGSKTVLPSQARAKITCRLVAHQDPDRIAARVGQALKAAAPPGVRVEVRQLPGTARPYEMPAGHSVTAAAAEVLTELYGRPPYLIRAGGSIPVCELFQRLLGVHTVGFGFALHDEGFHGPNEFYRLASFEKGQTAYCKLLHRLARGVSRRFENPLINREWRALRYHARDWRLWVGLKVPKDTRTWGLPAVLWFSLAPYMVWIGVSIAKRLVPVSFEAPPPGVPVIDVLALCYVLLGVYVCAVSLAMMAPAVSRERERETWEALRTTALRPRELLNGLLIGKLGPMLAAYALAGLLWIALLPHYAPLLRPIVAFRLDQARLAMLVLAMLGAATATGCIALGCSANLRSTVAAIGAAAALSALYGATAVLGVLARPGAGGLLFTAVTALAAVGGYAWARLGLR